MLVGKPVGLLAGGPDGRLLGLLVGLLLGGCQGLLAGLFAGLLVGLLTGLLVAVAVFFDFPVISDEVRRGFLAKTGIAIPDTKTPTAIAAVINFFLPIGSTPE